MDKATLICDKISETFNINAKRVTDNYITLYISDFRITLDYDEQYVRIHENWILIKAIDLEYYDVDECSKVIINEIKIYE